MPMVNILQGCETKRCYLPFRHLGTHAFHEIDPKCINRDCQWKGILGHTESSHLEFFKMRVCGHGRTGEFCDLCKVDKVLKETNVPLEGVGPETEVVVNEHGGAQSKVPYRFDLLDPKVIFEVAKVLDYGVKKGYAVDNWRAIDVSSHLNHALMHEYAFLAGDTSDDHLAHALCRIMFALGVEIQGGPDPKYGTPVVPEKGES